MRKVTALLSIRLWVDCPHCNEQINLLDTYENEKGSVMHYVMQMHKRWRADKDEWKNIGMDIECEHCKKTFIFDGIEY